MGYSKIDCHDTRLLVLSADILIFHLLLLQLLVGLKVLLYFSCLVREINKKIVIFEMIVGVSKEHEKICLHVCDWVCSDGELDIFY